MQFRSLRAWRALAGLALVLGLAACGGTVVGNPSPSGGLASSANTVPAVDGCTVLSAQELANVGLTAPGTPSKVTSEVGCEFKGTHYVVLLGVDPARNLDGYIAGSQQQATFHQNKINGRRGALVQGISKTDDCSQFLELGSGLFAIGVTFRSGQTGDPCADAEHIGHVVEPKLPK